MEFGIRVPTAGPPQASAAFAAEVEAAGFDFMWMPDTPLLAGRWRDVYVHLTAAALRTDRIRLGPGVTNPLTRHPVTTASAILSLAEASAGRADLVAGTGYSSAYIIGRKAATLASMREANALWRSLFEGRETELGGLAVTLEASAPRPPIYLAASGPRMLSLAAEIADGVLIMAGASPATVGWALERIEAGTRRAARRREDVRRILVLTARVDPDRRRAIDHMRPCATAIYHHAASRTLLGRAGLAVPASVPRYVHPYPDLGHAVDWEAAKRVASFVPDEAVETMVALGPGEAVAARVRELMALDIDAIWWRDEQSYAQPDALVRDLVDDVLPRLR